MSRVDEIERHLASLGFPVPNKLTDLIDYDLNKTVGNSYGCISPGGSSVRDWIRLWLSEHKLFRIGGNYPDTDHVTGVFHFYPWDEHKYGKQPTGNVGTNLDTMRSPLWRLRDANPINRVALWVTNHKE